MANTKDLLKKTPVTTTTPATVQQPVNQQSAAQNQSVQKVTQQTAQQQNANGITSGSGTSSVTGMNYQQRLQELGGGSYTPSQNVQSAQQYLQSILDSKPGAYQSQYSQQLNDLYNQIMNREDFSYDINGDALYQQYRDQYTQQGQNAMRDTMGQAAAMTGGYGSSYATTAGNQAYQSYLQQLNEVIPELYSQAYQRYVQQGQELKDRYNITQSADATDYGRYRDTVSDWQADRGYAQSAYEGERSFDYNDYATQLNKAMTLLGMEQSDAQLGAQQSYQDKVRQEGYDREDSLIADERAYNDRLTKAQREYEDKVRNEGYAYEDKVRQEGYSREDQLIADEREYETALRQEGYSREDQQLIRQYAYETAMQMISSGAMPTAELLALAGISEADALALAKKNGYRSSGGGSGSSSGSKGSGNDKTSEATTDAMATVSKLISMGALTSDYQKLLDKASGKSSGTGNLGGSGTGEEMSKPDTKTSTNVVDFSTVISKLIKKLK